MPKLSAFVTTYNDEQTLRACLESLKWVDELVVLDSFSTDRTVDIAREYTNQVYQQRFLGYGSQKQSALERTTHEWVLFLDSDEALSASLQVEIQELLRREPGVNGFEIPRQEQMFWRMADDRTRHNLFLRLFRRSRTCFSDMPVHAAPVLNGTSAALLSPFYHFGERTVHEKVDKLNGYSTGLAEHRVAKGDRGRPLRMLWYPPLVFAKQFVLKRHYLNGWAGFIASVSMAFYAFLKCAKVYEIHMQHRHGNSLLPPESLIPNTSTCAPRSAA